MTTFIRECLSENGSGSSKRLIAFMCAVTLNLVVLFVVIWDTIHSCLGDKDKFFVVALILFDLLLLGLATTSQLIGAYKGGSASVTSQVTSQVTVTETAAEKVTG